tara:strand:- start:328 stop:777 length:450 start_codon:yes stop_codon:yes gene_type:complete
VPKNTKTKIERIILASDHAGFNLKKNIKNFLTKKGKKILDLGTESTVSVDYPDFAHLLSKKMKKNNRQLGILVCGSGIGMSIAANKHKNVRAALCYNAKSARLSREHNNANVIAIGARLTKKNVALKCVDTFIKTNFKGGRHLKRIRKI